MKTIKHQLTIWLFLSLSTFLINSCSQQTTSASAESQATNNSSLNSNSSSANNSTVTANVETSTSPDNRESLNPAQPQSPKSLFDHIYHLQGVPTIELNTNLKSLVRNKMKEKYQPAGFDLIDDKGNKLFHLDAKVRARGNMRKQVSYYPPLKLDFKKSDLSKLGLLKLDDLKVVLPNNRSKQNKERLFKEYLLYQIYQSIEPTAFQAKLINVNIKKGQKDDQQLDGIVVEDEASYAERTKARVLDKGVVRVSRVDRPSFAKMVFFQYMIANTDYSVTKHHNIKMVQWPGLPQLVAVPYDYDYSGFVGHEYALPNPILPIEDVHTRYFFKPYKLSEAEFEATKDFYLSIEQDIYDICDAATYMDSRTIKGCKNYIEDFYDELKSSKSFKEKATGE